MSVFAKAKASRSRALKSTISGIAILGVSALLLSACASSGSTTTGGKDLSLKIGSILPQTGTLAVLGPPEIAGVDLAVKDINAANAGLKISVTHKDSGDTSTDIATQSATALLASGVSVIVGAASSGVSKTIIDQITTANVIEISGANTSPDFSNYPDNGYYWRTAPSDVLQGRILGNKILKVYSPSDFPRDVASGGPGFAIALEPMTAPPNALNSGTDLIWLEPGVSWSGSWGVRYASAQPDHGGPR